MKFKLILLLSFFSLLGFSQTGTVSGTILDKEYNDEPLPFANVSVKGTSKGASTDENGKYTINNLEPGNYTLVIGYVGYETKEIPFTLSAGETKVINETLAASGVQLKDIVVQATVSKEKETALLMEQQKAIEMKQAIGAEELSRKGVSDATAAVTKTTGVSKQEGVKNVFVRGLGDRYNSTSLNGLPLPSEDPRYKNIALSFFTTDIIKNINVNKTFSADLNGDVAGANIDIASKELEKSKVFSISAGTGFNTNALNNQLLVADGYNYFGFLENGKEAPINSLNSNAFDTKFKPLEKNNVINTNFSLSGGGKIHFSDTKSLSLFAVVLSTSDFSYRSGKTGSVNSTGGSIQNLAFKRTDYSATQTALGNIKYKFGSGRSIAINSLYIHDNKQFVGDFTGFSRSVNDNSDATNSFIRRQQLNNNNLFVNQILFDYEFSTKFSLNISTGYNMIRGSEPDRKTNSYDFINGQYVVATNSSVLNHRYFSTLDENDYSAKAEGKYTLNPDSELKQVITVGGNIRKTERDFSAIQFNYNFFTNTNIVDIDNPDAVFNQENLDNGVYDLRTGRGYGSNAFVPYTYNVTRDNYAGYAQILYPFNEKLTVQAGARFESIQQKINWDTNISSSVNDLTVNPAEINKTYILPSLNAKYSLNEKNAIRLAASQTYTMPQFKENAPFLYEDVTFNEFGNPDLVPSTNINFDLKYDWYIANGELFSIGGFYKNIQDPINRIRVASAANEFSFVNTGTAFATGVEVELRKNIIKSESEVRNNNLSFGLNASYLYSEQKLVDTDKDRLTVLFTNSKSKLEGATPLLINSDLSYNFKTNENDLTSTLVFNYFYDKVYSIGTSDNQNIIEKTVPTLDFVNKFTFKDKKLTMNLGVKNILNPRFRFTQETTDGTTTTESLVQSYRKGLFVTFGLNWNL
ncbi:TonB-dependent receptor [Flavobacterium sediminis]|uniref:TonB-dependent receptor n=1 Tax=Flavobacterium sediminis TaxID=2201181 RepID=A0A2U8QVM7_9FLAO|nr:TonB-dependent receptor [Flavobacterium sediminis]AWM13845.1 TonB-dependent receptor [Flavobacterium sediminis]